MIGSIENRLMKSKIISWLLKNKMIASLLMNKAYRRTFLAIWVSKTIIFYIWLWSNSGIETSTVIADRLEMIQELFRQLAFALQIII